MATYAQLNPAQTAVVAIRADIDPAVYAAWVANGNPKAAQVRPVTMTAQPTFDPNTQAVEQTGWTISATDVQPVWAVQTLSAAQQTLIANQASRLTLINNAVTALQNADANWATLTAAQKDTVLRHLVKTMAVLLNQQANLFQATS